MATSNLAARCPACGTVFRVVPDQLRVSEGWVRCGRCAEVFNATVNLVDVETGAPRKAAEPGTGDEASSASAGPASTPKRPPWPQPAAVDEPPPAPEAAPGATSNELPSESAPLEDDGERGPDAASGRTADEPIDPRAEPEDKPAFVREAERAERWQRPRVRAALAALAAVGAISLVLQLSLAWRDLAAARFPALRPALVGVCEALGCSVQAARDIGALSVESSGLTRVEKSSLYKLQVALRNRADIDVALPALDLVLSDSQGRVVARKVLHTQELGAAQATIGTGRELALQATLQAQGDPGAAPVAGYTIELFYP